MFKKKKKNNKQKKAIVVEKEPSIIQESEDQTNVVSRIKRVVPRWYLRIHLESLRNEYFRVREDKNAYASWIEDMVRPMLKKLPFKIRPDGSNIAYVSKAALKEAQLLGMNPIEIMSGNYDSDALKKYDKGHKKLMHEHVVPVKEITKAIENPQHYENVEEIIDMMEIALITKEEDKMLTAKGFQSERPNGWKKCYEQCGIEIVAIPLKQQL